MRTCSGIPRSLLAPNVLQIVSRRNSVGSCAVQIEHCKRPLCTHSQFGGGLKNLDRVPSLWLREPNVSDGVIYPLSRRLCVASAKSFNFLTHLLNVYLLLHRGLCDLI